MAFASNLPLEIIDIIIGHLVHPGTDKKFLMCHQCQYRNCISYKDLNHHQELLNLSQVSHLFRQRALCKLWSTIIVRQRNHSSLSKFICSTPNYEEVYLKYIKTILFEIRYPYLPIHTNRWFFQDEKSPFGVGIKGGKSYCAWAIKNVIYSIQNRNLQHTDFINRRFYTSQIYQEKNLFPFWLCVSKQDEVFIALRNKLNVAKGNDPENGIFDCLSEQSQLNGVCRIQEISKIIVNDTFLLKQVKVLCNNGWKLPQNSIKQRPYDNKSDDGCVHM